jgi:hypothetical protein
VGSGQAKVARIVGSVRAILRYRRLPIPTTQQIVPTPSDKSIVSRTAIKKIITAAAYNRIIPAKSEGEDILSVGTSLKIDEVRRRFREASVTEPNNVYHMIV